MIKNLNVEHFEFVTRELNSICEGQDERPEGYPFSVENAMETCELEPIFLKEFVGRIMFYEDDLQETDDPRYNPAREKMAGEIFDIFCKTGI